MSYIACQITKNEYKYMYPQIDLRTAKRWQVYTDVWKGDNPDLLTSSICMYRQLIK